MSNQNKATSVVDFSNARRRSTLLEGFGDPFVDRRQVMSASMSSEVAKIISQSVVLDKKQLTEDPTGEESSRDESEKAEGEDDDGLKGRGWLFYICAKLLIFAQKGWVLFLTLFLIYSTLFLILGVYCYLAVQEDREGIDIPLGLQIAVVAAVFVTGIIPGQLSLWGLPILVHYRILFPVVLDCSVWVVSLAGTVVSASFTPYTPSLSVVGATAILHGVRLSTYLRFSSAVDSIGIKKHEPAAAKARYNYSIDRTTVISWYGA